jgi:TonB family protein
MTVFIRAALAAAVAVGLGGAAAFGHSGDAPSATSTSPVKVYQIGGDVKAPELLASDVANAAGADCQGSMAGKVVLSAIVDSTGRARNIMFIRPLGNSLDKLALTILSAERFKPGEKDGTPIAAGVSVEMRLDGCFTTDTEPKRLRLRSQPEITLSRWPDAPEEAILIEATPSKDAKPYAVGGNVNPPVPLVMAQPKVPDPTQPKVPDPTQPKIPDPTQPQVADPTQLKVPDPTQPKVPDRTKKAKYEGEVMITLMVDEQGMPQNPRVVRRLGMGLDQKALEAVMLYRFKPAMQNGKRPVPVLISVAVKFQLY